MSAWALMKHILSETKKGCYKSSSSNTSFSSKTLAKMGPIINFWAFWTYGL